VPACWPYAVLSLPAIFAGTAAVAAALAVLSFLGGPARSAASARGNHPAGMMPGDFSAATVTIKFTNAGAATPWSLQDRRSR
jgi:hypothetical protein